MIDLYQNRYMQHQKRKAAQLSPRSNSKEKKAAKYKQVFPALLQRRSQRVFTGGNILPKELEALMVAAAVSPSSCNRHGIRILHVWKRDEKELLAGLMVGGVGWMHRGASIFLFLADPAAYKSPRERDFMHYCDVGFMAMSIWLAAEALGLGAAYVNPNISHHDVFQEKYGKGMACCGALVVGHYEDRPEAAEHPEPFDIML